MRYFVVALIFLTTFSNCSPKKRTEHRIAGTWSIVNYQYTASSGLSYYPETTGEWVFSNCNENECTYAVSMTYSHPQITGSRIENGTYAISKKADQLILTVHNGTSTQTKAPYEIMLITTTDLKFIYSENGAVHRLILRKN